jgi:hypothetical protein
MDTSTSIHLSTAYRVLRYCHNPFLGYSPIHIFSLLKKNQKILSKNIKVKKRMPKRSENGQKLVEEV